MERKPTYPPKTLVAIIEHNTKPVSRALGINQAPRGCTVSYKALARFAENKMVRNGKAYDAAYVRFVEATLVG